MRLRYCAASNDFRLDPLAVDSAIPNLVWHVTDRCLLDCPFCFAPKGTGDASEWVASGGLPLLLERLGVLKVDLAGGEPLLDETLERKVEQLASLSIAMTITTSAVAPPDSVRWLISNSHAFARVIVSIDGDEARHDALRARRGAFNSAIGVVRALADQHPGICRVNTLLTRQLIPQGELERLFDALIGAGFNEWCLIEPFPVPGLTAADELRPSPGELTALVRRASVLTEAAGVGLTIRCRENYAGYWILQPDGCLVHRSSDGSEDFSICFQLENFPGIIQGVHDKSQWIPLGGGELDGYRSQEC